MVYTYLSHGIQYHIVCMNCNLHIVWSEKWAYKVYVFHDHLHHLFYVTTNRCHTFWTYNYLHITQVFCHEYNILPPNSLRLLPKLYQFALLPYLLVIISFRAKLNSSTFFQVHVQVQCLFFKYFKHFFFFFSQSVIIPQSDPKVDSKGHYHYNVSFDNSRFWVLLLPERKEKLLRLEIEYDQQVLQSN